MSKQSEAKKNQGYIPKAVPGFCMNCVYYKSDIVCKKGYDASEWTEEINKRCRLGWFAVHKMGTCNKFQLNPALAEKTLHTPS